MLSDLLGRRRRIFPAEDTHEANVVDPIIDRIEGLEETRQAVTLNTQLGLDLGARRDVSGGSSGLRGSLGSLSGRIHLRDRGRRRQIRRVFPGELTRLRGRGGARLHLDIDIDIGLGRRRATLVCRAFGSVRLGRHHVVGSRLGRWLATRERRITLLRGKQRSALPRRHGLGHGRLRVDGVGDRGWRTHRRGRDNRDRGPVCAANRGGVPQEGVRKFRDRFHDGCCPLLNGAGNLRQIGPRVERLGFRRSNARDRKSCKLLRGTLYFLMSASSFAKSSLAFLVSS
jgi:hypothetical protein